MSKGSAGRRPWGTYVLYVVTALGLVGMVLVLAGAYLAGRRPRATVPAVPAPSEVVAAR